MQKVENKYCKYCGKAFHPIRKTREFCSRECSTLYRKEHNGYIVSEETRQKMHDSHLYKNKLPSVLKCLPDEEIKRLKNDIIFDMPKLALLKICIESPFPGTKKWPANHPIWECNVAGKMSPKEAWINPQMLIKAIDNLYDMLRKGIFDYIDWVKKVQNAFYEMEDEILEIVLYRFTIAKIAPKVTALMPTTFVDIIEKSNIDISSGIYCPMAGFGGIIEGAKRYYKKHNINAEIEAYDINPIFCNYYGWQQRDVLAQHVKTNKIVFVCPPFGPNTERWKGTPDSMYYEFEEWVRLIKEYIDAPNYIFVGPEINSKNNNCGLFAKKYGIQWYPEYSVSSEAPESTESALS